jgi:hypothetical protein
MLAEAARVCVQALHDVSQPTIHGRKQQVRLAGDHVQRNWVLPLYAAGAQLIQGFAQ